MEILGRDYKATTYHLIKYKIKHIFVLSIAGLISLLLFGGIALTATVNTKTAPKISSVPAPKMKAPTVSVPVQTVTPKVTIKAPTQTVAPKTRVPAQSHSPAPASPRPGNITRPSGPTRTVTPKVHIKTPARTRPQPGSTVKVLPPPNPPTRPQIQPRVNIEKPVRQLPPVPTGNYPPPWPPLNRPANQPGDSAQYPEIPDPPNMPGNASGMGSAYAPGTAARPGSNPRMGGAYNQSGVYIPGIAPRFPDNAAIRNPNFNDPRLENIREIDELMEMGRAAQRAKEIENARAGVFSPWGARTPADPAVGTGLEGKMPGSKHGNNSDENIWRPGGIDNSLGVRTGSGNDNDANPQSAAPTASGRLNTSRQGWVSDDTTMVETIPNGHRSSTVDEDGNLVSETESTTVLNEHGGKTTTTTTRTRGAQTIDIVVRDSNGDKIGAATEHSVRLQDGSVTTNSDISYRGSDGQNYVDYYRNGEQTGTEFVNPPDSQPNEVDQGGGDSCGRRDVLSGKCMDTKPTMEQMTGQPGKGDADSGPGSPTYVIGPDAVTDYEHGNRGGGGGGFNPIDMKDPPKGGPDDETMDAALGVAGLE